MIRKVVNKDFDILFKWINDEEVVKNSRYGKGKTLEEFIEWFNMKMEDKNSYMFIMEKDEKYVGQISFEVQGDEGILTYSVEGSCRGRGYGSEMVRWIDGFINEEFKNLLKKSAYVSANNRASIKVFERCGYIREIEEYDYLKFIKE